MRSGGSNVFKAKKNTPSSTGVIVVESFGDNARISVESALADADLILEPKNNGHVKFGSLTASSDAPITGYVTHKLANGALVKLAVIA